MIKIELLNVPEDRTMELDPVEWAQLTYGELRTSEQPDGTGVCFANGIWVDQEGNRWTDIEITAA